jgi:hypothetical protein
MLFVKKKLKENFIFSSSCFAGPGTKKRKERKSAKEKNRKQERRNRTEERKGEGESYS